MNEKLTYALGKWKDEYFIIADKRISELVTRTNEKFKTLLIIDGSMLSDMVLEHPLFSNRDIPVHIFNEVTHTYGTGINSV